MTKKPDRKWRRGWIGVVEMEKATTTSESRTVVARRTRSGYRRYGDDDGYSHNGDRNPKSYFQWLQARAE
ncbi:hypothetical protein U1Q18_004072 [Sarracenia purpurea var. burkii]